ncbi:MAG: acyl-CoA dehydrogenase family protein, partial [Candidatus Nanopelagicales bacterium]
MTTDPFTTPERRALANLARDFTEREITPVLGEWEDAGELAATLNRDLAKVGLLAIGYPEDLGGSGGDVIDVTVMTETILTSGGSGGVIAGAFSHGIAIPHIIDRVRSLQASVDASDRA